MHPVWLPTVFSNRECRADDVNLTEQSNRVTWEDGSDVCIIALNDSREMIFCYLGAHKERLRNVISNKLFM